MGILQKFIYSLITVCAILFFSSNSFATNGRGNTLNNSCAANGSSPYNGDCTLCHVSNSLCLIE